MKRIITFERLILIPLDLTFVLLAIMYFLRSEWFGGSLSIIVSLLIGLIGQSLHKDKSAHELLRGDHLIPDDAATENRLSPVESHLLGKAILYATVLLSTATVILRAHNATDPWWLVTLTGIAVLILFPSLSILVVLFLPKVIGGLRGKG